MSRRIREKRTVLRTLADGLLLLLLVYGAAFSFLTIFVPVVDLTIIAAGLGIFCLLFLGVFCLPKYRWAVLLVLALLYGFFLWQTWSSLTLGEVSLRCSAVNLYAQALTFLQPIEPLAKLTQGHWEAVGTLTFLTIAFPITALVALGTVRLRSFWLPFWCTFPVVVAPMIVTKTPGWLPLMALVAAWAIMLLSSLVRRRDPEGGARLVLVSLPAVGLLLLLLTVCLPRQGYAQPRWAASAQMSLLGAMRQLNLNDLLSGGLLPGGLGGGNFMAAAGSEDVNLAAAGPLQYTGGTVLKVKCAQPGKMYLRGYTAATYDGTGWGPLPEGAYSNFLEQKNRLSSTYIPEEEQDGSSILGYQPINFPALTSPNTDYHAVTIENIAAPDGCVYFPYNLITTPAQVAGAEFVEDSYLARDRKVRTHTVYFKQNGLSNQVDDYIPLTNNAASAELNYRNFVYENYLAVPTDTEIALNQWIDSIRARPDYDALMRQDFTHLTSGVAFDKYGRNMVYPISTADYYVYLLSLSTQYNPKTPVTPAGEDFVSYFLNESKEGYCMHYASAAAMLLRMYGIPTRYVSGYVTNVPASGTVSVPDYAAHAWVEIYLDGYGWYPVDVTPGYGGQQLPWQETAEPTPTPSPSPSPTPTPSASQNPNATPTPAPDQEKKDATTQQLMNLRILIAPGILLALALLLVIRRAAAEGLRLRRFHGKGINKSVLVAYRYLLRLQRWGCVVPQEAETLAQKARFSQHDLTEEEREQMLDLTHTQAHKADSILSGPKRLVFRYLFGLY